MFSSRPAVFSEKRSLHGRLQDSLGPVSRVVGAVLGPDHAVAQMLRAAAEANLSPATLTALRERERIQQVPAPFPLSRVLVAGPYHESNALHSVLYSKIRRRTPAIFKAISCLSIGSMCPQLNRPLVY